MPKRKRTQAAADAVDTQDTVLAASGEDAIAAATAAVLALSEPLAGFPSSSPRRASTRARKAPPPAEEVDSPLSELEDDPPVKKKRTPRKKKETAAAREESPLTDLDGEEAPVKKKRARRKKVTEPIVYDILPVERKETKYTGRLGYACLNTILRATKPEPVFCSRTCRLDTIRKNGIGFAKDLGLKNARDLKEVIEVRSCC